MTVRKKVIILDHAQICIVLPVKSRDTLLISVERRTQVIIVVSKLTVPRVLAEEHVIELADGSKSNATKESPVLA